MRLLIPALVLIGCFQSTSLAQLRIGDISDSFYGAQRGRVVSRPHGGFRLHYGRGLTQQGAGVITTAIGTLGPMLPLILGAQTPLSAPNDAPASAPSDENCMQDDTTLDALANSTEHKTHMDKLKDVDDILIGLLNKKGAAGNNSAIGSDGRPPGGGTANPPQSAPPAPQSALPAPQSAPPAPQ